MDKEVTHSLFGKLYLVIIGNTFSSSKLKSQSFFVTFESEMHNFFKKKSSLALSLLRPVIMHVQLV